MAVLDTRTTRWWPSSTTRRRRAPTRGARPTPWRSRRTARRLFVAEADNNAVAVFDLSPEHRRVHRRLRGAGHRGPARGPHSPWSGIPRRCRCAATRCWWPTARAGARRPNPDFPQPPVRRAPGEPSYTMGQLTGTLSTLPLARATEAELAPLSARVARANGWDGTGAGVPAHTRAIEHVIYIIKENRTYDQVFGDIPSGDGDTSLVFFPRAVSPNHHALAERFGLFDRFFVNAEASPDGHNWSMAAYTTDYLQKTVPSNYSDRGRTYDYEGTNRGFGHVPWEEGDDDVNEPANGYLWDLAEDAGITFRNFGEFVVPENVDRRRATCPRDTGATSPSWRTTPAGSIPASTWTSRTSAGRRVDRRAPGLRRGGRHAGAPDPAAAQRPHRRRQGRALPRPGPTSPTTTWPWAASSRRCRRRRSGRAPWSSSSRTTPRTARPRGLPPLASSW